MMWYWIGAGIVLALLELVVPGAVLVFLGLAAVIVGLLLMTGLISGVVQAFTAWFIISLILLFTLRGLAQRFMPGEESWQSTDEDADAYGLIVEVSETIEKMEQGRIRFRDSTWPATCYEQTLETGAKARIVTRDNLVWVVEPVDEDAPKSFQERLQ
jgi:membrane protein implicated in regulation of membrane protease activity